MYRIYADDKELHDPSLIHEGCGVLSPKVTAEINKAGSLTFTLPTSNNLYGQLEKLKTKVKVFQNDEKIFTGRVLNDDRNFYNQKNTYCEGEFSYLIDSIQRPYSYSGSVDGLFRKLINNHNSRVEADKRFTVGKVTVEGEITCNSNDYPTTLDEINKQIIDVVGGIINFRDVGDSRYIDLIASSKDDGDVETSSQIIEFGVNLLDITEHITAENIYTVIIPLGKTLENDKGENTDEKLDISEINDGKDYIEDETAVSLFGRIERKVDFSDCDDPHKLMSLGSAELKKNIKMSIALTVKAVDMHLLNVDVELIKVGTWVRVLSHPHKLDDYFQCTRISYDLEKPENNEYEFGFNRTSLTDTQVNESKNMKSSVSQVLSTAGAVNASVAKANQAKDTMDSIISELPTDYVQQATFDEYKSEVSEDFEELQSIYNDLQARVKELEEGGSM